MTTLRTARPPVKPTRRTARVSALPFGAGIAPGDRNPAIRRSFDDGFGGRTCLYEHPPTPWPAKPYVVSRSIAGRKVYREEFATLAEANAAFDLASVPAPICGGSPEVHAAAWQMSGEDHADDFAAWCDELCPDAPEFSDDASGAFLGHGDEPWTS